MTAPRPQNPTRAERIGRTFTRLLLRGSDRRYYDRLVARYGRTIALDDTLYFTRDPEVVRHIFLHPDLFVRDFQRGYQDQSARFWGNSYSLYNGDTWLNKRTIIHHLTQPDHIARFVDQSVQVAAAMTARWDSAPQEIHPLLMRLTMTTTAAHIFGYILPDDQLDIIENALLATFFWFERLHLNVEGYQSPEKQYFEECMAALDALMYDLIRAARHADPPRTPTMLSILMSTPAQDGHLLDDQELRDEIVTLLRAGHRNDGTLIAWCIALLGLHGPLLDQLRAEADAVSDAGLPQTAHLERLPFAHQVVQEALRCFPLYEIVSRTATADTEIAGLFVPQNTVIAMDIFGIQNDPAYFERPAAFAPDRWTDELAQSTLRNYTFAPFAVGPRRCPYQALALGESVLLLAYLYQYFDFNLRPNATLKTYSSINGFFPKDGIPAAIEKRV